MWLSVQREQQREWGERGKKKEDREVGKWDSDWTWRWPMELLQWPMKKDEVYDGILFLNNHKLLNNMMILLIWAYGLFVIIHYKRVIIITTLL